MDQGVPAAVGDLPGDVGVEVQAVDELGVVFHRLQRFHGGLEVPDPGMQDKTPDETLCILLMDMLMSKDVDYLFNINVSTFNNKM